MAKNIVEQTKKRIEELETKRADESAKLNTDLEKLEAEHVAQTQQMESDRAEGDYDKYQESEKKVKGLEFKIDSIKKYIADIDVKPMTTDKECAETKQKLHDYSHKLVDEYEEGTRKKLQELRTYIEEGTKLIGDVYGVCFDFQKIVCKDVQMDFRGLPMNIEAVSPGALRLMEDTVFAIHGLDVNHRI